VAESGVTAIEEGIVFIANEELAARAVGIVGPGHRDDAPLVRKGIGNAVFLEFAFDAVARSAIAAAIRIAALDHEAFDDAMKGQAVIKAFIHQLDKVRAGVRRRLVIQLNLNIAKVFDRENNHVFYLVSIIQEKRVHVVKEQDFF
jgi:hypothetical protein